MDKKYRFQLEYYTTSSGRCRIKEWIISLAKRAEKGDSDEFDTVQRYLDRLRRFGVSIGFPTVKPIPGTMGVKLWELRPKDNRVFFAVMKDDRILLLHYFVKDSPKTPPEEIRKAEQNYKDHCKRYSNG